MTRNHFLLAFFFLFAGKLSAQGNHSLYLEIGGNGLGLSANYDARFSKNHHGFGFRAGVGFYPGVNMQIVRTSPIFLLPLGVNYVSGKGLHHFEGGLGLSYFSGSFSVLNTESKGSGVAFVPSAGYRFSGKGKGIQFRAFISPFLSGGEFFTWGGISIGYRW
ncbi:MAG: hypothetical protein KAX45_05415 [Chitinophagaceae bacterium]|nr:hypothetical protein [Chitinophagaceae bacterium]MBP8243954.1 hypothetical protein [Chitinophagaceae bacterium]